MTKPPVLVQDGVAQAVALSERVHWIGALDPSLRTFDIILKTANGTSYNAYIVRGSAGVAIVDTVKENFADDFFARLESVARYDEIKVIVLNHLEPDHTGALPELMRRAPQAQLYISQKAQSMLKALLKQDAFDFTPVMTGDTVSLGDRTLTFFHTPYLHWPDTQCTYLIEEQTLFSGDVFGCHFCDTRLFKEYVNRALALLEPLALNKILPAHGPLLRDQPQRYVQRYLELSRSALHSEISAGEKTLLIFYISSYGNTRRMAEAVYEGAMAVEHVRVSLYDLEGSEIAPFVDLIEGADGILFGTPTINGDAVKPVWDLLSSLVVVNLKSKLGGVFGSYGWTGEGVKMVEDRLRGLKLRVPIPGIRIKLIPTEEEIEICREFGHDMAQDLMGLRQPKVIDMADLA